MNLDWLRVLIPRREETTSNSPQQPPPVPQHVHYHQEASEKKGTNWKSIGTWVVVIILAGSAMKVLSPPDQKPRTQPRSGPMRDVDPNAGEMVHRMLNPMGPVDPVSSPSLADRERDLAKQQEDEIRRKLGLPPRNGQADLNQQQAGGGYQQQSVSSPQDMLLAKRQERVYESLFSGSVVRPSESEDSSSNPPRPSLRTEESTEKEQPGPTLTLPGRKKPTTESDCLDYQDDSGTMHYAVCESTMVDAILQNQVVSEAPGPVKAKVSTPVLSHDRLHVLLPVDTLLIGTADAVTGSWQNGMKIRFHRVLRPDFKGIDLDAAMGLDPGGASTVRGRKDRHLTSTIVTTLALGALAGVSLSGTGNYYNGSPGDYYRQGIAQQSAMTAQQQIGRQTQRPPTITLDPGQRVPLYLDHDYFFPEYLEDK